MNRILPIALVVILLASCLPTRNRTPFEKATDADDGDAATVDMSTTDTDEQTGDTDGNGGDDTEVTPDMPGGDDACQPQSDEELCAANQTECGSFNVTDNCGTSRTLDCGTCDVAGVGCVQNSCVETNCRDEEDNDQTNGADCEDPNCRGEQCSASPNKVCQPNGNCG